MGFATNSTKQNMRSYIAVIVGALTIGSAATDAFINSFTESGCTGGSNSIGVAAGKCVSVSGASANQDKSQNGIKFTCDGYTDSACTEKVGEVYDCLSGSVAYVNCVANPAL